MTTHTTNMLDTRYGSLRDYVAAANMPARNTANDALLRDCDKGEGCMGDAGWAGAATTAEAVSAITGHYADGAAIISRIEKAAVAVTLPPTMDTRRRRVRSDQGDNLDIHAVYRGQIDRAWDRMGRRQVTAPPMVSIVINSIILSDSPKTVISYRGAVGIVLCQMLERYGYRVRLVVARGGEARTPGGADEKFSCRTTIKDYGMPLDRETVTCATHPAMQRVLGLRWTWAQKHRPGTASGSGVGEALREKGEIFISSEVTDEKTSIRKIHSVIKDLQTRAR